MGKKLVYTTCTSKMSTTLKAYNLAIFGQNSTKLVHNVQGGPLNLRDLKNGQEFGVYRMYQQNEHHFEGGYLAHF